MSEARRAGGGGEGGGPGGGGWGGGGGSGGEDADPECLSLARWLLSAGERICSLHVDETGRRRRKGETSCRPLVLHVNFYLLRGVGLDEDALCVCLPPPLAVSLVMAVFVVVFLKRFLYVAPRARTSPWT